ncbi:MAG: phosphoribosyltransferase family protein [Oscillospiraceae bacterium]|nr:phosphoribosyltransferase family protein [Oscillospiraceae bacterium]
MNTVKNLNTYVGSVTENGFSCDNIIVEHRSNNPKRDFLFVNRKQCKHIPCSAHEMIAMCRALAEVIKNCLSLDLRIAVVAFAETATAIGNFVADEIPQISCIFQTTREPLDDSSVLFEFREEHSHAVRQRIYGNRESFTKFDYILIVDDEITTGNTALNFIEGLNCEGINLRFGIASICNWQNERERERFRENGIDLFYLLSGKIRDVNQKMAEVNVLPETVCNDSKNAWIESVNVTIPIMERLEHKPNRDLSSVFAAVDSLKLKGNTVRVIGTEEFMYVPICVAEHLENLGFAVACHSTTRSPIDVISREPNGIHSKICLPSVYDRNRTTYLYNIEERTDIALLVTDAVESEVFSCLGSLLNCGRFVVVRISEGK